MSETRDDLREALARAIFERGRKQGGIDPETWEVAGDEMQAWLLGHADAMIAGPFAPILAQVSALQAEVEEWRETFTDEAGTVWRRPTAEAYAKACVALQKHRDRADEMSAEVERLQKVEGERDEAIAEVTARLNNYSLSTCLDCGGQGHTDQGKSACFWCRGAGVITQQMAHAFEVADRATARASDEHPKGGDPQGAPGQSPASAVTDEVGQAPIPTLAGREGGENHMTRGEER